MEITRRFPGTFFRPTTIREAIDLLTKRLEGSTPPRSVTLPSLLWLTRGQDSFQFDDEEQLFAALSVAPDNFCFRKAIGSCLLDVSFDCGDSRVSVASASRSDIDAVLNVFQEASSASKIHDHSSKANPAASRPKIFIGHGRSPSWRDLKDHLAEKHGYEVVAYEVGARAGHTIRDILEEMLTKSSMAFLVLTGEDRDSEQALHARENVIHETGLFQGRLGFSRSIVILEEGTVEFSNIQGIQQLRFSKENIKEVFGDAVATIRREFGAKV